MGSIPTLSILHGDVHPLKGKPLLLHRLLEQIVCLKSQHNALTFQGSTLSFGTLDATASRITRALLCHVNSVGAQANQDGDFLVAVCMEPSDRLVITLLAVWKMGAAYLPLDPTFPPARVKHILSEAQPVVVIAEKDDAELFDTFKNIILYEELCQQAANLSSEPVPDSETLTGGNTSLALVLYTSGSTGIPKGVRLPHQVVLNRLCWQWRAFPYGSQEHVCVFKTALTFVDSVAELWGPLLQGRNILVVPRDVTKDPELLLHVLEEQKVQRLVLVPSLLRSLLLVLGFDACNKGLLSHLKTWVCSGEPLTAQLARDFFAHFNSGEHVLCNFYGSTEVMGDVTYHVVRSASEVKDSDKVPIGRSIDNTAIYLLDENHHLVVSGEVGELYVSGLNIAQGYVRGRDPHRFLPNPLTVDPDHSCLYRTGDFARLVKGTLIYEGRTDSQVKVRGHRVDLSEVQNAVAAVPGIDKSVVLCYRPGEIEQALLAYVTKQPDACLESHQVETVLQKSLASYMQPQVFVVDSIPLLVNGKTDRQELLRRYEERNTCNKGLKTDSPELDYTGIEANQMEAAHTLFETVVLVLGGSIRSKVCRSANFYDLGGNSLNSVFTVTKLREQGYVIGITKFTSARDLQDIIDQMCITRDSDNAAAILKQQDKRYAAHMLQNEYKDAVNQMITESFYEKADLEQWLKSDIHRADYKDLTDKLWEPLLQKNLSFLVKDVYGQPAGVALNFDAHDEPSVEIVSKLAVVFDFLEFLEGPIREKQLPQGKGKVLHSFMMATNPSLNYQQNVEVMDFMEDEVLRLAQSKGFAGIFTTNTSPLTQQLGDVYDYEVLLDYQVNLYVAPDGSKPFQQAPDSQTATCSWRPVCSVAPK
jgi:amino acid adenylation domain-containing protein